MSKTFRPYAPTQRLLLPPSIEDWVPEGHLARFIDEVVEDLDLSKILEAYDEERGYPPYDPRMMAKVLLYAYATGTYSSRRIAAQLVDSVAFRCLGAGLQELWLDRYFDCVAASCDVGYLKPHPAIFEHVLRQMSIDARRRRWSAIRYAPNVGVGQGGGRDGHLVSQRPAWRTPRRLRRPTIRSTRSPICGASPWGFGRPVQATDHGELFVGADCQSRGCVSKRVRRTT